jgi:hypothetical protein
MDMVAVAAGGGGGPRSAAAVVGFREALEGGIISTSRVLRGVDVVVGVRVGVGVEMDSVFSITNNRPGCSLGRRMTPTPVARLAKALEVRAQVW